MVLSCFSFLPRSCCSHGSAALPGMLQGPGQRGGEGASSQPPPPSLDAALCPPRPPRGWWPCPAVAVPPSPLPRSMEPGINIKSMPPEAAPFNPFAPTSRHPGGGVGRTDGHNRAPPTASSPTACPLQPRDSRGQMKGTGPGACRRLQQGGGRAPAWPRPRAFCCPKPAANLGTGGSWVGDTGVTSHPGGCQDPAHQDARARRQPAPPHQAPDLHFYFFLSEFRAGGGNCRPGSPAERGLIPSAAAPGVTLPWGWGSAPCPPSPWWHPGDIRGRSHRSPSWWRSPLLPAPFSPPPGCPKCARVGDIPLGFWGCAGLGEQGVTQGAPPQLEGFVGVRGGQHGCPHGDKGHLFG